MNKVFKDKTKIFLLLFIFIIFPICKYFQYNYLPSKYFVDSNKILLMISNSNIIRSTSYIVTANFFRFINIFDFKTLIEWSIFIGITFSFIYFILLKQYKSFKLTDLIYIYISIIILNIFSFNLSKEVIQIIIFFIIYFILLSKKGNFKKIIYINIILLIESIFFRNYYILLLLAFDILYIVFHIDIIIFLKKSSNMKKSFYSLIIFLFALGISSFLFPNAFNELLKIRTISENSLSEANTVIINVFTNSNYFYYMINYIINLVRILFPFELIKGGIKYVPFIIYQVYTTLIIYNFQKKNNNNSNQLLISLFIIAYFITSAAFEPDFGSVIRHQSTMFLIILLLKKGDFLDEKN